jgi:hypothetical protein
MPKAIFRFYEELNDFLPKHKRKKNFETEFEKKAYIKDLMESLGVPHSQIDLILVNGKSVDWGYTLKDGDRVSVYPVFEFFNIKSLTQIRNIPLRKTRFIADVGLDGLAKRMKELNFDVYHNPSLAVEEIMAISKCDHRIVLTQRRKVFKSSKVTHRMFVRPGSIENQIKAIVNHLNIKD